MSRNVTCGALFVLLVKGGDQMKSVIRLRMSSHDAHYGGNLVDGARMLGLFGDVATELLIQHDGDEGLFKAYLDKTVESRSQQIKKAT